MEHLCFACIRNIQRSHLLVVNGPVPVRPEIQIQHANRQSTHRPRSVPPYPAELQPNALRPQSSAPAQPVHPSQRFHRVAPTQPAYTQQRVHRPQSPASTQLFYAQQRLHPYQSTQQQQQEQFPPSQPAYGLNPTARPFNGQQGHSVQPHMLHQQNLDHLKRHHLSPHQLLLLQPPFSRHELQYSHLLNHFQHQHHRPTTLPSGGQQDFVQHAIQSHYPRPHSSASEQSSNSLSFSSQHAASSSADSQMAFVPAGVPLQPFVSGGTHFYPQPSQQQPQSSRSARNQFDSSQNFSAGRRHQPHNNNDDSDDQYEQFDDDIEDDEEKKTRAQVYEDYYRLPKAVWTFTNMPPIPIVGLNLEGGELQVIGYPREPGQALPIIASMTFSNFKVHSDRYFTPEDLSKVTPPVEEKWDTFASPPPMENTVQQIVVAEHRQETVPEDTSESPVTEEPTLNDQWMNGQFTASTPRSRIWPFFEHFFDNVDRGVFVREDGSLHRIMGVLEVGSKLKILGAPKTFGDPIPLVEQFDVIKDGTVPTGKPVIVADLFAPRTKVSSKEKRDRVLDASAALEDKSDTNLDASSTLEDKSDTILDASSAPEYTMDMAMSSVSIKESGFLESVTDNDEMIMKISSRKTTQDDVVPTVEDLQIPSILTDSAVDGRDMSIEETDQNLGQGEPKYTSEKPAVATEGNDNTRIIIVNFVIEEKQVPDNGAIDDRKPIASDSVEKSDDTASASPSTAQYPRTTGQSTKEADVRSKAEKRELKKFERELKRLQRQELVAQKSYQESKTVDLREKSQKPIRMSENRRRKLQEEEARRLAREKEKEAVSVVTRPVHVFTKEITAENVVDDLTQKTSFKEPQKGASLVQGGTSESQTKPSKLELQRTNHILVQGGTFESQIKPSEFGKKETKSEHTKNLSTLTPTGPKLPDEDDFIDVEINALHDTPVEADSQLARITKQKSEAKKQPETVPATEKSGEYDDQVPSASTNEKSGENEDQVSSASTDYHSIESSEPGSPRDESDVIEVNNSGVPNSFLQEIERTWSIELMVAMAKLRISVQFGTYFGGEDFTITITGKESNGGHNQVVHFAAPSSTHDTDDTGPLLVAEASNVPERKTIRTTKFDADNEPKEIIHIRHLWKEIDKNLAPIIVKWEDMVELTEKAQVMLWDPRSYVALEIPVLFLRNQENSDKPHFTKNAAKKLRKVRNKLESILRPLDGTILEQATKAVNLWDAYRKRCKLVIIITNLFEKIYIKIFIHQSNLTNQLPCLWITPFWTCHLDSPPMSAVT
jgi:hypothetical protein